MLPDAIRCLLFFRQNPADGNERGEREYMKNYRCFVVAAFIAAIAAVSSVQAQDYPLRLVRLVVPQAAGGGTDTFARAIGQKLSERWGQSVVIENRPGAE